MLNNRELSILLWIIILLLISFYKIGRKSFLPLISLLKKLIHLMLMPFSIIVNCYALLIFGLLWHYHLLEIQLIMTYLLWVFCVLYPSVYTIYSKHNTLSIKEFVKSSFTINLVFIFLTNQYTFPLFIELLFVALLFLLGALSAFFEKMPEYKIGYKICNNIIIFIGSMYLLNAIYIFLNNLEDLTTTVFWKTFAMEGYIVLHLPLLFFAKYYAFYEQFKIQLCIKKYYKINGFKIKLWSIKLIFKTRFNIKFLNEILDDLRKNKFSNLDDLINNLKN